MCGIFGIVAKVGKFDYNTCARALGKLKHRGPDDWGLERFSIDDNWEVWLGQQRLSIIDLSAAGKQPMQSGNGIIVFNGEIYNHHDLSTRLKETWNFQSRSDTEVLLAALMTEGTGVFSKLNGMMAMGFLDLKERTLLLARDKVGKKPLYIYESPDVFAFSSELKALVELDLNLQIDELALSYFRWLGYVPAHMTVYKECRKFLAGSYAKIDLGKRILSPCVPVQYWDPFVGYGKSSNRTYSSAIEEFLWLLDDATRIRLEADVPVGVFLSGGIDSTLVATSISKLNQNAVKAFTVKFDDAEFDESATALETAQKLGIDIEVLHLKSEDFARQVGKIPKHFDEPFSDISQVPTLAISEAARKYVTVVLTGDGGDEVFLGYPRFSYPGKVKKMTSALGALPGLTSLSQSVLASRLGRSALRRGLSAFNLNSSNIDSKINRLDDLLSAKDERFIYDSLLSTCPRNLLAAQEQLLLGENCLIDMARGWYPDYGWSALKSRSAEENFAALDLVTYMRDDVLVKVDRATMAYSLEARSPLLDYRIIEFGQSLPLNFKLQNGIFKRILRDALELRIPGSISKLKKRGFGVPLPVGLPPGRTSAARWNLFIEQQWKRSVHFDNKI